MMKKVNIKDVEVTEVEETKKFSIKNIVLIILICIVSLVGIFFWSTSVRWNSEIENYYEVLYYNQEEIKIDILKDFYGDELNSKLDDNHALLLYCSSEYGETCVTGDFNNGIENLLRNPGKVISIVILIDLVLLFMLFNKREIGKVKKLIVFVILLVYGIVQLGIQIYNIGDYYHFVNDSEYVANATIIKGLITNNKDEYYPVVTYNIGEETYTNYLLVPFNGQVEDYLEDKNKVTIYYDKKDNNIITAKKSLLPHLFPIIVSFVYIIGSLICIIKTRKEFLKQ